MPNPPLWGEGTKRADSDPSAGGSHDISAEANVEETRPVRRNLRRRKSQARTNQAINDAQQGLHSLLNPQKDHQHPTVISQSGAIRNTRHGRVAGPGIDHSRLIGSEHDPRSREALLSAPGSSEPGLSVASGARSITSSGARTGAGTQNKLAIGAARAVAPMQAARNRAQLLLDPIDEASFGMSVHAAHTTRRAAAQWVTRYATHLVVLLVVALLVSLGGLKTLTAQGALPHALTGIDTYSGTDNIGDNSSTNSKSDPDSQDFELTLPRTELSVPQNAANQPAGQKTTGAPQPDNSDKVPTAADVKHYTVAAGDSINGIADKFNILPETLMGSNGIFDVEEALAPGRVLNVPPVDAMYYVAVKGDTVATVSNRFQVDPASVASYRGNSINPDGTINEGQAVLVPGGMMPARETTVVYTVQRGDILKDLAARFEIDVPTIIESNDIPNPDSLQPGMQLRLLPVPGLEYKVKKGDTLNGIANEFGVATQTIIDFSPNRVSADGTLHIDQTIIVPGGTMPQEPAQGIVAARIQPAPRGAERPPERQPVQPAPPQPQVQAQPQPKATPKAQPQPQPKPKATPTPKPQQASNSPKSGSGSFMWPVNGTITQYFTRSHNGLDIAISAGTPIHAADAGRVVWSGWRTDGLGYCVMIDHLNGYTTVYGHMIRQPAVYVGQYVAKGQVIGYVGSTGHSTGPHVHFMIKGGNASSHNYLNPLGFLSR